MKSKQQGFTLVELIVVIVILGILAATALPRFINVTGQARTAAAQGVAGGLRSAVAVVQAGYQAQGLTGAANVTMAGGALVAATANGFPTAAGAGIVAAMGCAAAATECQGNTVTHTAGTPNTTTWVPPNANAGCTVIYSEGDGSVTTAPVC